MDTTFRDRFRNASPQDLVDALNREVGSSGWVTARGFYLSALREAFLATGLDCSAFIDGGMSLRCHVRLDGNRIVPIAEAPKSTREEPDSPPAGDAVVFDDAQSLIEALIRSMEWGNKAKTRQFGEQLVAQWSGAQGSGEDGVLRPFDELEASDFLVEVLDLSPERAEEIEEGEDLTDAEFAQLADTVEAEYFEADGSSEYWDVAQIEGADGDEAYVANTIDDGGECTFVGVFPSLEEAKQGLQRLGYLDGDDFRRRYPSRRR